MLSWSNTSGPDMAQVVGVAEVAVKDVIKNREAFQEAIDRELMHMRQKRFVREGDAKAVSTAASRWGLPGAERWRRGYLSPSRV